MTTDTRSVKQVWEDAQASEAERDRALMRSVAECEYKVGRYRDLVRTMFRRITPFVPRNDRLAPLYSEPRSRARYLLGLYTLLDAYKTTMRPDAWFRRCYSHLRFSEGVLWGLGVELTKLIAIDGEAASWAKWSKQEAEYLAREKKTAELASAAAGSPPCYECGAPSSIAVLRTSVDVEGGWYCLAHFDAARRRGEGKKGLALT